MANYDEVNKLRPGDPESLSYGATSSVRFEEEGSPEEKRLLNKINLSRGKTNHKGVQHYAYCVVYALVNVIIGAPALYGYAAVIFNNPIFDGHMNALSKLVIFSSLMHQLGFTLFSNLEYAIGMVQDAGLIFLSHMANTIADRMVDDGHSEEEILSTTLVLLCLGTAALGVVLILMGKFRLADAVAYLPMPVVGGYLAFIGYFCLQAGVALCISTPMMNLLDWGHIFDKGNFVLAVPGLLAGLVLTMTSRLAKSSGALPMVMIVIPALFYLITFLLGFSLDDLRSAGWVGAHAPSVPVSDLFRLVDFGMVRWDLVPEILPTWVGMVFVVSFSSCLDVAAIGIDRGEALDTNKELATVGICNLMSGVTFGFTGSYIFSQTIFTYRTGVHDRTIGVLIMVAFLYIVVSPVNVLEISPLFFLGSTLIFIGYDLMLEWLWEVRHQVFLTEYLIVCFTFCAIQVVGINFGVVVGVLVAIVEHIFSTAHNTVVNRVEKRSNAVWSPSDLKILNDGAYSGGSPRIVTLEVIGPVFFGSALHLLNLITDEIGLDQSDGDFAGSMSPGTPHSSSVILTKNQSFYMKSGKKPHIRPPSYLVLDLAGMTNLDASAARGCFLQLAKMCAKKRIMVCAAGASNKTEWMLRSHDVSLVDVEDEQLVKERLLDPELRKGAKSSLEKILLFLTAQEALEFCETPIVQSSNKSKRSLSSSKLVGSEEQSISFVLAYILGSSNEEAKVLGRLEDKRFHEKIVLKSNEKVFYKNTYPDAFYVVLSGCVARQTTSLIPPDPRSKLVLTGAGRVEQKNMNSAIDLFDDKFIAEQKDALKKGVVAVWRIGGIFGYLDYLMERQRVFQAAATQEGTMIAKVTRSHMDVLKSEDPELHALVQKALLYACTMDLAYRS
ncbi:unnamed protein product [Cylindrotheca closterium]|uniref:STAS domain-containing protein n=1 Tax=Cylindrotheca closterium TaxID=2856 RepID=A0AAD2FBC2_9STRA|nr:unnamed protein product [Cylindrotheca closterium]